MISKKIESNMRIGIYMPETMPSDGGSHTFLEEILQTISRMAVDFPYELVLLSWGPRMPFNWPLGIEFQSIWPTWLQPILANIPSWRKPIYRRARGCPCAGWQLPWAQDWLRNAADRAGVNLIWHASPDWLASPRRSIRTVWDLEHRHLPFFPEVSAKGKWKERERGCRETLRNANCILTGTQQNKEEIAFCYGISPEQIKVLPLPTPTLPPYDSDKAVDGRTILRETLGIEAGYLFYPAQFWPHKNHVNLFHALARLDERIDHRYHLVCCGSDAGNRPHAEKTAKILGLSDRVHFPGMVSKEILSLLYQHSFALVFPSFFGPDNLPPLEACRLGCPVITADWSGAREQIGTAALFFNPAQPDDIAAKVQQLHENPGLRDELIAAGRGRVVSRTPEDYVHAVFDEIKKIILAITKN